MGELPGHRVAVFHDGEGMPSEAEGPFRDQLAERRRSLLLGKRGSHEGQRVTFICALTPWDGVLGGVCLDIGATGGAGPLARLSCGCLTYVFVRPELRRLGLAKELLRSSLREASECGCEYIWSSCEWDNLAFIALLKTCGFAMLELPTDADVEPAYLAVRPLRNLVL
ncbi:MAG: GNAT family N-acetyltransferase [Planctomycetota bacterium]|jgi:GNAT superfamily N-acetyltransferase